MSEFVNTVDVVGERALIDSILDGSITEFRANNVTKIYRHTLKHCAALKIVDLGENVQVLDDSTFYNCSALETLIIRSTTALTASWGVCYGTKIASKTGHIYVPAALVDTYKAASNWKDYATQFRAIESYPNICG